MLIHFLDFVGARCSIKFELSALGDGPKPDAELVSCFLNTVLSLLYQKRLIDRFTTRVLIEIALTWSQTHRFKNPTLF